MRVSPPAGGLRTQRRERGLPSAVPSRCRPAGAAAHRLAAVAATARRLRARPRHGVHPAPAVERRLRRARHRLAARRAAGCAGGVGQSPGRRPAGRTARAGGAAAAGRLGNDPAGSDLRQWAAWGLRRSETFDRRRWAAFGRRRWPAAGAAVGRRLRRVEPVRHRTVGARPVGAALLLRGAALAGARRHPGTHRDRRTLALGRAGVRTGRRRDHAHRRAGRRGGAGGGSAGVAVVRPTARWSASLSPSSCRGCCRRSPRPRRPPAILGRWPRSHRGRSGPAACSPACSAPVASGTPTSRRPAAAASSAT